MCQSKLTVLVHKDFRQALASHQYREWVSPIVSLVDFPNLHCVICQEVMDDTGMVITKGTVGVIPYGIEAKHLGGRGKKSRQTWIRISFGITEIKLITLRCDEFDAQEFPKVQLLKRKERYRENAARARGICVCLKLSALPPSINIFGEEWMQQDHF